MNTITTEATAPIITWNGERVVTTEMLAGAYRKDTFYFRNLLHDKKILFYEGKHYYKLFGSDIRTFRSKYPELFDMHSPSIMLWTEAGIELINRIKESYQQYPNCRQPSLNEIQASYQRLQRYFV